MIKADISVESHARITSLCDASNGLTPSKIIIWALEELDDVEPKELAGAKKVPIRIYLFKNQLDRLREMAKKRRARASSIIRGIVEHTLAR